MYSMSERSFYFMGMIYGSLNHTSSGRKKKQQRGRRNIYKPAFRALKATEPYRRETPEYASAEITTAVTHKVEENFRKTVSSNYTVAPAYNKGAYQVISRENVKDIGR
jgi:hypothetical protein